MNDEWEAQAGPVVEEREIASLKGTVVQIWEGKATAWRFECSMGIPLGSRAS